MKYICYFDGSYRLHKGVEDMGIGCVITDGNNKVLFEMASHICCIEGSTNLSEYLACLEVIKWLSNRDYGEAIIRGDSKLVVNQLNGYWSVKNGVYVEKALETIQLFKKLRKTSIKWTSRNNNIRADELSKIGLNGENYIFNG